MSSLGAAVLAREGCATRRCLGVGGDDVMPLPLVWVLVGGLVKWGSWCGGRSDGSPLMTAQCSSARRVPSPKTRPQTTPRPNLATPKAPLWATLHTPRLRRSEVAPSSRSARPAQTPPLPAPPPAPPRCIIWQGVAFPRYFRETDPRPRRSSPGTPRCIPEFPHLRAGRTARTERGGGAMLPP